MILTASFERENDSFFLVQKWLIRANGLKSNSAKFGATCRARVKPLSKSKLNRHCRNIGLLEEDWREREKLSSKATSKTSASKSLTKTTTKTEKSDSGWGSNSRYKGLS